MFTEGVVDVNTFVAHARRFEHGWELHVEGVGVTQVSALDHAESQVRDLVETLTDADAAHAPVEVVLDFGSLGDRTQQARDLARHAAALQQQAAHETRTLVKELRAQGVTVADVAYLLGVTKGRVSQLASA